MPALRIILTPMFERYAAQKNRKCKIFSKYWLVLHSPAHPLITSTLSPWL